MKKSLVLMIIAIVTFLIGSNNAKSSSRENKGVGFEALDYEKVSGFEVNISSYLLLDSIVNECKSKIKIKTIYSYEDVNIILETIGSTIEKYKIVYDVYDRFNLYSKALENKKLDCKFYTLTYLTVSENLSLPLYSMDAPKHVFVYWKDNSNEIYWEATTNHKESKQNYIDSLKISEQSIASLAMLNAIDNKHYNYIYYGYCGAAKANQGDNKGAIIDYTKAIEFNPKSASAFNNRGLAKSGLGDKQGAIKDYTKAIELNPNDELAYNNKGLAKSDLGDNQGAIKDYTKAIELNPNKEN